MIKSTIKEYIIFTLVLLLFLGGVVYFTVSAFDFKEAKEKINNTISNIKENSPAAKEAAKEADRQKQKYDKCITTRMDVTEMDEDLQQEKIDILSYIKKYTVSVYYKNLTDIDSLYYNAGKTYFAASTAKLLDALYLYTKAVEGSIDLDDTLTYRSTHTFPSSLEMEKHKLGDEISLRDLVRYELTVSDNTAHNMVFDYVGQSTLRKFAQGLGIQKMQGNPKNKYGNIDANDAIILLTELDKFIKKNPELGKELTDSMENDYFNYLAIDVEVPVAHKYGYTPPDFHDIGIVYDSTPYALVVLTQHGKGALSAAEKVIVDIHSKINQYHQDIKKVKHEFCELEKSKP